MSRGVKIGRAGGLVLLSPVIVAVFIALTLCWLVACVVDPEGAPSSPLDMIRDL